MLLFFYLSEWLAVPFVPCNNAVLKKGTSCNINSIFEIVNMGHSFFDEVNCFAGMADWLQVFILFDGDNTAYISDGPFCFF